MGIHRKLTLHGSGRTKAAGAEVEVGCRRCFLPLDSFIGQSLNFPKQMSEQLPKFSYHPNPNETGVIQPSNVQCICCWRVRGFIYIASVYSVHDLDKRLCPWCIADGSAARKYGASFVDSYPLSEANVPEEVIEEVCLRTPGYESWQQEYWLSHCSDACEFHGDASVADIQNASEETKQQWRLDSKLGEEEWNGITEGYTPGGNPAIYKFVCKHCRLVLFGYDCS